MENLKVYLDCGHDFEWGESPLTPGASLPHVGQIVYCNECQDDQEITEIEPSTFTVRTEQLSKDKPSQTPCPPSGTAFTVGDEVAVFYDTYSGTWGYCFFGVGEGGNAYESENVTGFDSPDAALEAAREDYHEDDANEIPRFTLSDAAAIRIARGANFVEECWELEDHLPKHDELVYDLHRNIINVMRKHNIIAVIEVPEVINYDCYLALNQTAHGKRFWRTVGESDFRLMHPDRTLCVLGPATVGPGGYDNEEAAACAIADCYGIDLDDPQSWDRLDPESPEWPTDLLK